MKRFINTRFQVLQYIKNLYWKIISTIGSPAGVSHQITSDLTLINKYLASGEFKKAEKVAVNATIIFKETHIFRDKYINILIRQKKYKDAWMESIKLYKQFPSIEINRHRTNNLASAVLSMIFAAKQFNSDRVRKSNLLIDDLIEMSQDRNLKICIVIGNCQSPGFCGLLNESKIFKKGHYAFTYKAVHTMSSEEMFFISKLGNKFDHIITQNINSEIYSFIRTGLLKSQYPNKIITVPTCWFDAYFPDCLALSTNLLPDNFALLSRAVFLSYFSNKICQEAISLYEKGDFMTDAYLDHSLKRNADELIRRDTELDVKLYAFIFKYYKKKRLFYSPNHPNIDVLVHVCNGICSVLGLEPDLDAGKLLSFDKLTNPDWHIHSRINSHYNFEFKTEDTFTINHKKYTIKEYIEALYTHVDALPLDKIDIFKRTGFDKIEQLQNQP